LKTLLSSPNPQHLASEVAVKCLSFPPVCPAVAQNRREVRLGRDGHERCKLSSGNQAAWETLE